MSSSSTAVGEMKFGDHLCLPYDNDAERYAVLLAYIRDGLRSQHKIVYLAGERRPDETLARLVRATSDPDQAAVLTGAAETGQLAIRPVVEATGRFDPGESPALLGMEIERALAQGYAGARITGETSFTLRGRFDEFEDRCQVTFGAPGVRAMAVCQYDRRWFDDAQLRRLEERHDGRVGVNAVYADDVLTITPLYTPPGLRLAGAIDESTLSAVQRALREVGGRGSHLCLDLSALEFCDMEGLRVLTRASQSGTGIDRQVVLRGVPGYLGLMMRIYGWEGMPGVFVEEAVR
ncbi:MEDS domain-containing protein [Actinomadura rudentiformis]|uniref:STAS domain-containing protein n=1 Tax=Actinomadura rudentiformis TaxID=359158 RepID=A0A6H9YW79_9ACTN|nr:MEDS domain-containing protein [Actinomadura rudentiformis]KAB2345999.1 STAS domain-containing protein [Actinomadura rudentiformis]